MFKRLHNGQDYQGPGLGLAICYKMALKLNGKIEVIHSKMNEGTVIKLTIPKELHTAALLVSSEVEEDYLVAT